MTKPDPVRIADRLQFGGALTQLREDAGRTVREVAKAAGIPVATIGDYFSGRTIPPVRMTGVLTQVLLACGIDDPVVVGHWRDALARVRHTAPEPYRGDAPFQVNHAGWFFGRDDLVRALTCRLVARRAVGLPLAVTGRSRAGVSSVLAAGLIPALGSRATLMTPGVSPCRRLADLVCAATGIPADRVDLAIHNRPDILALMARDTLPPLVIDDFAELFTSHVDETARETFVAALTALNQAGIGVVVGLRAGFIVPERHRHFFEDPVVVDRMTDNQLRTVVEAPVRLARLTLAVGVADAALADVANLPAPLPSLSRTMLTTWRRREGSMLTMRSYRAAAHSTDDDVA